jgi:hypothetical protein
MDRDLTDVADAVCDEKSFLEFAKALIADRERAVQLEKTNPSSPSGPDAGGWENITIASFLKAAVAWAEDSEFRPFPSTNPWQRFAYFLYAGKIYE